ncbi:MAG: hypothetical protein Q4E17_00035 [Synergistes sp.]|nr:hypothetical protein [Synergistes sp.]
MTDKLRTTSKLFFFMACIAFSIFLSSHAYAEERKIFELRIPFTLKAAVTAVRPDGSVTEIGKVVKLPIATRYPSYTASAWATPGCVCASAVNAVHILVQTEKGLGRTMSIVPQKTIAPAAGAGAAVVVSTEVGAGIFGGWAPPVGSPVSVEKPDGTRLRLSPENFPQKNDTLIVEVKEESSMPYMADIENRPGGRVTVWHSRGCTTLGRVIVPVTGTGRFAGSVFQRVGRLRANHCGVVEVCTSPNSTLGAFQIIPWEHARNSKEMAYVWTSGQWLIIAPIDKDSQLKATEPLFKGALVPGTADCEKLWDIWSTYGRKSLVLARYANGPWQRMKPRSGKSSDNLRELTEIRIYFPFTKENL